MLIDIERSFRVRFDTWKDGKNKENWYHGWNLSEFQGKYTKCFVFKCKEERLNHRFYGFLCNPKPSNPRYEVCVLVVYTCKGQWETNVTDLKKVERIRTIPAVQNALEKCFKEKP